ncbi:NUDIX hydrolase [Actinomadura atramentaria]|uniref:NUDIX hydrolase n=1 Tax=Actinomadura atramentaria TaxID=1990 RepID=UPI000366543C|nr:NUDIX hydrolase [Actinomadura atramentaria]
MERVDVAYALVTREDKVLMVRNADTWSLPGGRRESGETFADAAVRETLEETGLKVRAGGVVSVSEQHGAVHDLFIVFEGSCVDSAAAAQTPEDDPDVREVAWVPLAEASSLMPWYPGGVEAMLRRGPAEYFVS